MSRHDRLQIRASEEELSRWKQAADLDTLSLSTWARQVLERTAKLIIAVEEQKKGR